MITTSVFQSSVFPKEKVLLISPGTVNHHLGFLCSNYLAKWPPHRILKSPYKWLSVIHDRGHSTGNGIQLCGERERNCRQLIWTCMQVKSFEILMFKVLSQAFTLMRNDQWCELLSQQSIDVVSNSGWQNAARKCGCEITCNLIRRNIKVARISLININQPWFSSFWRKCSATICVIMVLICNFLYACLQLFGVEFAGKLKRTDWGGSDCSGYGHLYEHNYIKKMAAVGPHVHNPQSIIRVQRILIWLHPDVMRTTFCYRFDCFLN